MENNLNEENQNNSKQKEVEMARQTKKDIFLEGFLWVMAFILIGTGLSTLFTSQGNFVPIVLSFAAIGGGLAIIFQLLQ